MRYILVFLWIFAGCTPDNRDISIADALSTRPAKSDNYRGSANLPGAFTIFWPAFFSLYTTQENSPPKVKIHLPKTDETLYSWDEYVRYSIEVSDEVDGDSKYGEININEVLLEIEYLPITKEEELNEAAIKEKIKIAGKAPEPAGLSLLKKSTCFGCHADKSKHSGPSFSEIAGRYENSQANIAALAGNISGGSTGVWGSMVMPSHPDLTVLETQQIAEYILTQGARKNSWVLPGLEGTFRITKKPENSVKGFYILTASYTSTSKIRGQHSVILGIQ